MGIDESYKNYTKTVKVKKNLYSKILLSMTILTIDFYYAVHVQNILYVHNAQIVHVQKMIINFLLFIVDFQPMFLN